MELRLHTPAEADAPNWTVRQAFEQHVQPLITGGRRAAATLRNYRSAISHWETFVRSQTDQSGPDSPQRASSTTTRAPESPTVGYRSTPQQQVVDHVPAIDDGTLDRFGAWLITPADRGGAGLSIATASKVWGSGLRPILRRVGPRETGNPRALDLIPRVPSMQPLELLDLDSIDDDAADDGAAYLDDDQLAALYHATDVATWPPGPSPPPLQWKTLLVWSSCMGTRAEDSARLRPAWLRLQPESPVTSSAIRYAAGWLCYVPTKTRRKKRGRLIVPLPPCVRVHLDAMRIRGGCVYGWTTSTNHTFRRTWQAIAAEAGLPWVRLRMMRSTANVRWNRTNNKQLGRWALGHAARDINDRHYMNIESDLVEAAPLLPVPACFDGSPTAARQPRLF